MAETESNQQTMISPFSQYGQANTSMLAGASNFTISGSPKFQVINISEFTTEKSEAKAANVPLGYKEGMTDFPPATPFFTGRKDILQALETYFVDLPLTKIQQRRIFLLVGMGGAGKTQCALGFVQMFMERFTKVYLISAHSRESIEASFYDIAIKNGPAEPSSWEAGLRWLANHKEEWLLLYDNADNPEINLGHFFPQSNHGNIIITSRNHSLKSIVLQYKEIRDMKPDDAVELLLKHAIKDHSPSADERLTASAIANKLHHVALALVQAGSYIAEQNCLSNYLSRLEKHQSTLMSQGFGQSFDNLNFSIYTSWNLSWQKLDTQSKTFLQICSCLHYEGIPRMLFERALNNISRIDEEILPAEPLLAVLSSDRLEWDDMEMDRIIKMSISYSLISIEKESMYSLHPLIHQWIADVMDKTNKMELEQRVQSMIAVSINGCTEKDIGYLRSLVAHCTVTPEITHTHTMNQIATMWYECGFYEKALPLREVVLKTTKETLGEKHAETHNQQRYVANTYRKLGRYKDALELQEPLLEMSKEVLGEQHPDTLTSIHNLAVTYSDLGRHNEALQLEEPLVGISKQVLGEQHPSTLTRIQTLAVTYSHLGRYNEALQLEEPLFELSKQVLGEQHPHTLGRIQNLALTYSNLGRYNEALQLKEPLVEMSKQVLGEQHPDTLSRIQNLTLTYSHQGRYNEALQLSEPLVEMSKQVLGEQHPHTLSRIQNLAKSYLELGRDNEALQLSEPLVELSKQVLGEQHPDTLTRIQSLAVTYSHLGRYNEALQLEEPLLDMSKQVLGKQHPHTLARIQNVANRYSYLGRYSEALQLYEPLVERSKLILGEQHPNTLRRIQNLATICSQLQGYNEVPQLEALSEQVVDSEHPDTLSRIQKDSRGKKFRRSLRKLVLLNPKN